MTKEERKTKKAELRDAVRADYNKRFPRLRGTRLTAMVKQKADMQLAEYVRALATVEDFVADGIDRSPEGRAIMETDLNAEGSGL